jgi:purine-cytosine permease-like protein
MSATELRGVGELTRALSVDQHGIEPIPDGDRFLAGGIKIKRWMGSIISGVVASAVMVGFLASTKFVTSFTNYMNSFVIWTASWGVIVIIDFFVLNRGRADVPELYASPETSRYGDTRWRSLVALGVGLVAGWTFEHGSASLFQGPISRATNGVDFSWLASIVFGGLAYWLLCRSEPHLVTAPSLASGDGGQVVALSAASPERSQGRT